jgi:hypothetical protein
MNSNGRLLAPLLGLTLWGLCADVLAADEAPIPAKWQVQEINYTYSAFTTAYNCDAAADKVKAILRTLGVHPKSKVQASGCPGDRPSRTFFMKITAATPIPTAEFKETSADQSRQELLKRLGAQTEFSDEEFPAAWKSIELSKERSVDLEPGDCELMEGLRKQVLPKLGVKIEEERIVCRPNQLSLQRPELRVSALVPLTSPDTKTGESR